MTILPLAGAAGAVPLPPDPAPHAGAPATDAAAQHAADAAPPRHASPRDLHPLAQHAAYAAQAGGTKASTAGLPDAATRTFDVAKTSQADVDALKQSRDPAQRRLGHTIENAKASYADLLARGARIVVALNAGNGGHPVMTVTAPGFDPKLPARIHTHYHGDNATVADPVGSKAGQGSRIRERLEHDPQTVFVLPECRNATDTVDSPTHDNHYQADWSNVASQARTTDDALKAAGIAKVESETVSVHSRGGGVIAKLMHDDPTGGSLRADRLELHDSLYGSQGAVAAWGRTDNGRHVDKVIYVHGSNGEGRDKEIAKAFKGSYVRIDIARQRHLDDTNNPVVYNGKDAARHDGNGHKATAQDGVRRFHSDPHYQTTGRYLGIWPLPN
jgi:hypothetical protein